ncbi:MAG: hypothetical protein GY861_08475 [bacterium]|nr:hypothetical protein [bacterium]
MSIELPYHLLDAYMEHVVLDPNRVFLGGNAARGTKPEAKAFAYGVGRETARRGKELGTGGCIGLPHHGTLGALEEGGNVTAFSPARTEEEHVNVFGFKPKEFYDRIAKKHDGNFEMVFTGTNDFTLRNIINVMSCGAAIFVYGSTGTGNELTAAIEKGKIIGIASGFDGIVSDIYYRTCVTKEASKAGTAHDTGSVIVSSGNIHKPEELVDLVINEMIKRGAK